MKLSEISAAIAELKATITGWGADKAKATTEAIAIFQTKLTGLESGAAAELAAANASLATAQADLGTVRVSLANLINEHSAVTTALAGAVTALKITDLKPEATALDRVSAIQTAVSTTLAKLNVQPGTIPAPAAQQAGSPANVLSMTRADFEKLTPQAKSEYFRKGGKLTE